jgi:ribA/ribD-fused uncharacterized protein
MTDTFFFYSKSRDALPGKGVNETVHDPSIYDGLAKIKDWRRVLSNFHQYPFKYEGHTYNTIEHVFQAKKIALADVSKAYKFTVESGDDIGQGDGEMARKHRKLVKLDTTQLKAWNSIKDVVMRSAAIAKYQECTEARRVLLETKDAQLWHIVPRSQPVRFEHLEDIRTLYQSS